MNMYVIRDDNSLNYFSGGQYGNFKELKFAKFYRTSAGAKTERSKINKGKYFCKHGRVRNISIVEFQLAETGATF